MATPISHVIESKEYKFTAPNKNINIDRDICFQFFEAIRKNEISLAKELLKNNPYLTQVRDKDYFTAFMRICFDGGSVEILDLLIDADRKVIKEIAYNGNCYDFYGYTGIAIAAARNQLHIIKHLTQKFPGDEIQQLSSPPYNISYRIFHVAAKYGHKAILEYLHSLKTDEVWDARNLWDYWLPDRGYSSSHSSAFKDAMENGHLEAVQYLMTIGCTPLVHTAAEGSSLPILKLMVESDLNGFHENENEWSSIVTAANANKLENVKYLLSIGANIGTIGWMKMDNFLNRRVSREIIQIIEDCNALVSHYSCYTWNIPKIEDVKASLSRACTLNFRTREGTLFHVAFEEDTFPSIEMLILLFETNIDRTIKNNDGLTALQYGVKNGKMNVIAALFKQLIENVKKDEKLKVEEQELKIQALLDEFESLFKFAEKENIDINYRELFDNYGLRFILPFVYKAAYKIVGETLSRIDTEALSNLEYVSDLLYIGQLKATIKENGPAFEVQEITDSHRTTETKEKEIKDSKESQSSRLLNLKLALAYAIRAQSVSATLHAGTALLGLDIDPIKMSVLKDSCKSFDDAILCLLSGDAHKKAQETLNTINSIKSETAKLEESLKKEKSKTTNSVSSLSLEDDEIESTDTKSVTEDDKTKELKPKFGKWDVWYYYVKNISAAKFLELYCAFHKIDPKDPSILALLNQKPLHKGLFEFETLVVDILERERNLILKEKDSFKRLEIAKSDKNPDSHDLEVPSSGYTPGFSIAVSKKEEEPTKITHAIVLGKTT